MIMHIGGFELPLTKQQRIALCGRECPKDLYVLRFHDILSSKEMNSICDLDTLIMKGLPHREYWLRPCYDPERRIFGLHLFACVVQRPQDASDPDPSKRYFSKDTLNRVIGLPGRVPPWTLNRIIGAGEVPLEAFDYDSFCDELWNDKNGDLEQWERIARILSKWSKQKD